MSGDHHGVRPDPAVVADRDVAQDADAAADVDPVLDRRDPSAG